MAAATSGIRVGSGGVMLRQPTEDEAIRLAQSRDLVIVRLYTGRSSHYPSVAEPEAHEFSRASG